MLINTGFLDLIIVPVQCLFTFTYRAYHKLYTNLFDAENSKAIQNISGCLKPCRSKEYKQVFKLYPWNFQHLIVNICNVTLFGAKSELENVKSFTRTNINKPDFTPRKAGKS